MFHKKTEIDLLEHGLDRQRGLIEPLKNLHTGSKRKNLTLRLPFLVVTMMLITLGVELPAKQALAAPMEITDCRKISKSGSYVLTNNLIATGDCLVIAVNFVTIDLAGFSIRGNGTGTGITVAEEGLQAIAVRNGSISKFFRGVLLGQGAIVEGLFVVDNQDFGILVEQGILKGNVARNNGIGLSAFGTVTGNLVSNNRDRGISAGGVISGNRASNNGAGIEAFNGSTLIGNTATNNTERGIEVSCPSNLTDNTAVFNGTNLVLNNGAECLNEDNLAP